MLTWAPGSSSGVAGYYVFRSLAGGQYTQLTTALVAATTYTDTTVQPGQTYDYEVTSVGSSNVQSAYSNVASASIP
jgi:fibronectin type 3 domain-containing protein